MVARLASIADGTKRLQLRINSHQSMSNKYIALSSCLMPVVSVEIRFFIQYDAKYM